MKIFVENGRISSVEFTDESCSLGYQGTYDPRSKRVGLYLETMVKIIEVVGGEINDHDKYVVELVPQIQARVEANPEG